MANKSASATGAGQIHFEPRVDFEFESTDVHTPSHSWELDLGSGAASSFDFPSLKKTYYRWNAFMPWLAFFV